MVKNQVLEEEFNSKSEAINYLIKKARSNDDFHNYVQMKIDKGLKSGRSTKTKEELLSEIMKELEID